MPRARRRAHRAPIRSLTGYAFECPEGSSFDETAMETALAAAKRLDLITEYDTGRGSVVWFSGPAGEGLRTVRARVIALLPPGSTPIRKG